MTGPAPGGASPPTTPTAAGRQRRADVRLTSDEARSADVRTPTAKSPRTRQGGGNTKLAASGADGESPLARTSADGRPPAAKRSDRKPAADAPPHAKPPKAARRAAGASGTQSSEADTPRAKARAPKAPNGRAPHTNASSGRTAAPRRQRIARRELPAHATTVWDRLAEAHPDATCELTYTNAFELICATILSAQCTDKRVNMVTPALFAAYADAPALAAARVEDVEAIVRTTGFYHNKAKNLVAMARALVAEHGGEVPATMDALVVLPGVGRKTANVVLGNAYGINVGVTVDTHVHRLSRRLGLAQGDDPVAIERELMPLFPQPEWAMLSHRLIFHGRRVCDARRPRCGACTLADLCPSAESAPV